MNRRLTMICLWLVSWLPMMATDTEQPDATKNDSLPVVVLTADRATIYPSRLNLHGDETLLDILLTYSDMLTNAYDNWLDGYSIRINNGPYGGDLRMILTKTLARDVQMVQISDNPGVAKASTGMNGVVDVFMKRTPKGVHGATAAEVSTNLVVSPFVGLTLGTESTDIIANASYNFAPNITYNPATLADEIQRAKHHQYANFHMINQLSEKDQLVTYFVQSYEQERNPNDTTRYDNRNFNSQIRHYHDFDPTTNLMTAVVYQHTMAPTMRFSLNDGHTISFMSSDWQGTVAAAQELNKTWKFGKKGSSSSSGSKGRLNQLNLMTGWEVDYGMGTQRETDLESQVARRTLTYRVMNADVYAELDYQIGKWRLTFGDRVMFYRYRVDVPVGDRSHNDVRNMLHASVIFNPHPEHHIQFGYFHKFYNPSYMGLFREAKGMTDEEWLLAERNITETGLNEVKLGYTFARSNATASANMYYYRVDHNYGFFKWDAAASYSYKFFSIAGGFNFYSANDTRYATFRIAPKFRLPYEMMISARTVFYTSKAPSRMYNNNRPVYASLRFDKQLGKYVNLYAIWHDIFSGNYGVGLLGVDVVF